MTQAEPPQQPLVPFNPSRVPQQVAVVKEPQGCSILIVSPLTTTVVLMDRDEALALAAQIREAVGGLQIIDGGRT